MSIAQGVYGVGAFVAPLISTQFARQKNRFWAFHFLISLGVSLTNIIALTFAFRLKNQDGEAVF